VYLKSAGFTALLLLTLLPFAYLIRMCVLRYVDVPAFDDWGVALRLGRLYDGTLTPADFWTQHNEHRPALPLVILTALARLTAWNTNWEIVLNIAVGVGIFAVYCAYLRTMWRAHGGAPLWMVPLFSLLLFSPVQWENWLRGWQLTILLGTLLSVVSVYRLTRTVGTPRRPATGIGGAVCATFCFASGLVLFITQALGVAAAGGPRRTTRLALWGAAGALTWSAYFYHFERPPQPSMLSNFKSIESVRMLIRYVLAYLGAPIAGCDHLAVVLTGLAGLLIFVALVVRLRHLRGDAVFLFPVLLAVQTILTALISGLGRAWMGIDQALSSRYTTVAMPLWCAIACLLLLWRRTAPADAWVPVRRLALASVVVMMAGLQFQSTRPAVFHAAGHSERLYFARRGLITGKSDVLLRELVNDPDFMRRQRDMIKRHHLSVFRPSLQPSFLLPADE
jgi:hypothetical protein